MIVEFLCNIFFGVVNFFVSLMPTLPDLSPLAQPLQSVFWVVRMLNMLINIKVVAAGLILILIVHNVKFVWSMFMWLLRKIPGVS